MNNKDKGYMKTDNMDRVVRTELILMPLLVFLPMFTGAFLIYDWYIRDISWNSLDLFGELLLGVILIIVNILFDIPFIRSLRKYSHDK